MTIRRELEKEFGCVIEMADPIVANFVARHEALLKRVTELERALEQVANWNHEDFPEDGWRMAAVAQEALDG